VSKHDFSALMDELGEVYDRQVSATLKRLYWDDLGSVPVEALQMAARLHRRDPDRGRFFPKPADFVEKLERLSGDESITADEAWAIALASFDERNTICTTDEIMQAAAVASPIYASGDKVGARLAFRAAFERALAANRAAGKRSEWRLSLGWDADARQHAVSEALRLGRITEADAAAYLPPPAPAPEVLQLTGNVLKHPRSEESIARKYLREFKARIAEQDIAKSEEEMRHEELIAKREEFESRRAKALKALERMEAGKGK